MRVTPTSDSVPGVAVRCPVSGVCWTRCKSAAHTAPSSALHHRENGAGVKGQFLGFNVPSTAQGLLRTSKHRFKPHISHPHHDEQTPFQTTHFTSTSDKQTPFQTTHFRRLPGRTKVIKSRVKRLSQSFGHNTVETCTTECSQPDVC